MCIAPQELERLRQTMAALDPAGPPRARIIRRAPGGISVPGGHLCVLDASFNPMTLAHERMVEETRRACGVDEALLMLSHANVDKGIFGADLGQRLATLLPYVSDHDDISLAGCSHARFVDKVEALRPLYPEGTRFTFIIGHDTLLRLFARKYYADMEADLNRLFAACGFVAANRGPNGLGEMRAFMARPECRPFADRVRFIHLNEPYAGMSSTQARERRKRKEPIRDLVPEKVAQAIQALMLYVNIDE